MQNYDYIVIGAGMGGLSTANFLAKYDKKVIVLEKHSIPGGLVTSFARKNVRFDLGLHGLYELKENQAIWQFLNYFGASPVETILCQGNLVCYSAGKRYVFRPGKIKDDFLDQFPGEEDGVERLFTLMDQINQEMFSGGDAPEPPDEMNLFELIRFGLKAAKEKPSLMKYGRKDAGKVLDQLELCAQIKQVIYSLCPYPMVFLAFAYQWGVLGRSVYPKAGMQAIPDAAAKSLQQMGAELHLNQEVVEILVKEGRATGVRTKAGQKFYGRVISSASPHFTYSWIRKEEKTVEKMKKAIAAKEVYPSVCALFLGVDDTWDTGKVQTITFSSQDEWLKRPGDYTKESAPIVLHIYPRKDGDALTPLVALMPLPYHYENRWNTGPDKARGKAYRELKRQVEETMLLRLEGHLGHDFRKAVVSHELGTPMTFERYTYNQKGSFMGWSQEAGDYGRYLKQTTAIRDLYLVGQWVFPGFGVAGVMASGYYLARRLLKEDGIDLKREFKRFFSDDAS